MSGTGEGIEASQSQLMALNEKMLRAEQGGTEPDVAYLATVLSDDLLFRRADRTIVDKATFLRNVPSAAKKVTGRRAVDLEVDVRGQSALVTMTVTGTVDVAGLPQPRAYKNIRFFAEREGRWLLEHWYNEDTTTAISNRK